MAKVALTASQRQNRAFMAALRYGQEMKGERDIDTAHLIPSCAWRTYYKRIKRPETFTVADARTLAQRYFNDRQLCEAFGVEYHGNTPA